MCALPVKPSMVNAGVPGLPTTATNSPVARAIAGGDGITPVESAHLDKAENVLLPDVVHSPKPGVNWYGSPAIVPQWAQYLA
jgi:hypothetical protein